MIQYSCASVRRRSMAAQGGALAEASPYLGSIFPVVMLIRLAGGRRLIGVRARLAAVVRPGTPSCLCRSGILDRHDVAQLEVVDGALVTTDPQTIARRTAAASSSTWR